MIGFLRGRIIVKTPDALILEAGGVGYEVTVPASSLIALPVEGEAASLHIHTHVREDALRLFGFASMFDRKVFEALIGVSSVGPKLALSLLGPLDGVELCHAIANNQLAALTRIPGVGAKTAERLILELKAKVTKLLAVQDEYGTTPPLASLFEEPGGLGNQSATMAGLKPSPTLSRKDVAKLDRKLAGRRVLEDLQSALSNLGYKDKQVAEVMGALEARVKAGEDVSLEGALRDALKSLTGHVFSQG